MASNQHSVTLSTSSSPGEWWHDNSPCAPTQVCALGPCWERPTKEVAKGQGMSIWWGASSVGQYTRMGRRTSSSSSGMKPSQRSTGRHREPHLLLHKPPSPTLWKAAATAGGQNWSECHVGSGKRRKNSVRRPWQR